MFVKGIMKPVQKCITANVETPLKEVLEKLEKHDNQGLPIIDAGKFIGMVSLQMIYRGYFKSDVSKEEYLANLKAKDVVGYSEYTVTMDSVFESTLARFKGFPILAVVDEKRNFLGVVSRTDVIEQFESAFGVNKKGVRIAFTSEESEGRILRLAEIIKHYHENVISLATFDETDKLARRIVLKIESADNVDKFARKLERSGFRVLDVKEM